jgi:hypothetical protein
MLFRRKYTMRIVRYRVPVNHVPVDFFADPDGDWEFDALVEAAGFEVTRPGIQVGALADRFADHPEGSAVVAEPEGGPYLAIIECVATANDGAAPSQSAA